MSEFRLFCWLPLCLQTFPVGLGNRLQSSAHYPPSESEPDPRVGVALNAEEGFGFKVQPRLFLHFPLDSILGK